MSEFRQGIADGLRDLGLQVDDSLIGLLVEHLELVYAANAEFNLTRIAREDAAALHVIDSLFAAASLAECPPGGFADLGSGAGFPGIPLAIVSGRPAVLVESVKKKAEFLRRAIGALRLESTVRPVRAEELAETDPGSFGAVTARALSSLPSVVELAAPLLVEEGVLIAFKARPEVEELERGRAAARLCGMVEEQLVEAPFPRVDSLRTLVIYRRHGCATLKLPRRPGMAQRRPLA
jgi:16S rRNA (guanine527-N7)-methyltransferase